MQKVAVTTETVIDLEPELAARLAAILSTYQDLKEQMKLYEEAMKAEAAKVLALMLEAGHEKIEVDGTPCTIVRGFSSRLDKTKFVQLGGSLKQLENATAQKPKKPYVLIGKTSDVEEAA